MQFYVTTLEGSWEQTSPSSWEVVIPPAASEARASDSVVWIRGGETLKIVAGPAGLDVSDGTEMSLLLRGAE